MNKNGRGEENEEFVENRRKTNSTEKYVRWDCCVVTCKSCKRERNT
jgi:hypothetical protein